MVYQINVMEYKPKKTLIYFLSKFFGYLSLFSVILGIIFFIYINYGDSENEYFPDSKQTQTYVQIKEDTQCFFDAKLKKEAFIIPQNTICYVSRIREPASRLFFLNEKGIRPVYVSIDNEYDFYDLYERVDLKNPLGSKKAGISFSSAKSMAQVKLWNDFLDADIEHKQKNKFLQAVQDCYCKVFTFIRGRKPDYYLFPKEIIF